MQVFTRAFRATILFAFLICLVSALAQNSPAHAPVVLTVVDENNVAVSGAEVVMQQPGKPPERLTTDFNGRVSWVLDTPGLYTLQVQKPGFYASTAKDNDPAQRDVRVVLNHEQMVVQQVNVAASVPGIDPEQVSDKATMDLVRDRQRALSHLARHPQPASVLSRSGCGLNAARSTSPVRKHGPRSTLLDGFDIRSPVSGILAMRVSADAVRSIDQETTRYPVEFGRSTGGVVAFYTGMGDNKFRFNATDFLPSWHEVNGLRFDKFVPRFTFSGPLARNRAWFFDGLEVEYDNIYIKELPQNANTNHLIRGSNLFRVQVNATSAQHSFHRLAR